MDVDDDDDFYAPDETVALSTSGPGAPAAPAAPGPAALPKPADTDEAKHEPSDELEEGEEEDEGAVDDDDDEGSDVDIITDRRDATPAEPPAQARYNEVRNIPQRSVTADLSTAIAPAGKRGRRGRGKGGVAAVSMSTVDVNAIPPYKPASKPITQVNIDEDLTSSDKPWRKTGADLGDYFNYGFDEFTWSLYAAKQEAIRGEYRQQSMETAGKQLFEDALSMFMGGGVNAAPGGASGQPSPVPGAGPLQGDPSNMMTPEMQQMMQQMMASGMDPSQMDPNALSTMFSGASGPGGAGSSQTQAFGTGGFSAGQNQGFGSFDQQGGGAGNRGGFGHGGRGKGGRRW